MSSKLLRYLIDEIVERVVGFGTKGTSLHRFHLSVVWPASLKDLNQPQIQKLLNQ
jgi:hypothetical protein